jgi:hypothetical protein
MELIVTELYIYKFRVLVFFTAVVYVQMYS